MASVESINLKIKEIEDEMARTQKNKATNQHMGLLKAKIAKLKRQLVDGPAGGGGGGKGDGFDVNKSGDARVGLVGFPSVGKSTLLNTLTNTFSEAAAYEFTTLTCIPGVVKYKGAKIQLLDLPGIIEGAKDGKGRGRQVIAVGRSCNLICLVLDAMKPLTHKRIIERELEAFGIRLNKKAPLIKIKKKEKGGIVVIKNANVTKLDDGMIKSILHEYKLGNCEVVFEQDADEDQLIDAIEGNRKYVPCLYILNKIDEITMEELDILDKIPHYVPCSAHMEWNLDTVIEKMWEYLDLIRIYTKPKGQIPDYNAPVVIPRGFSIEGFCNRIHRQLAKQFKHAMVWGLSVKHNPQKCGKEHILQDEDVVQIIKKI